MSAVYEYSFSRKKIAEFEGEVANPTSTLPIFRKCFDGSENEKFVVLCLDTKNKVIGSELLYMGNVAGANVRVGEVFRNAVRLNATSIIIGHNHPSNDVTPSGDDLNITEAIVSAGKLLDIPCLDHIIVGDNDYKSLRGSGMLRF